MVTFFPDELIQELDLLFLYFNYFIMSWFVLLEVSRELLSPLRLHDLRLPNIKNLVCVAGEL